MYPLSLQSTWLIAFCLAFLVVVGDCIRLIRENGYRPNSHYYHLGDGGHVYYYNTETLNSIYFKCIMYKKGCQGRAILRIGGTFSETQPHSHPADANYVGERHFKENVKQRCDGPRFMTFSDIIEEERANLQYSRRVRVKMTLRKLRSSMYRARMKRYPQGIPRTLRELTQTLLQNPRISETIDDVDNLYAASVTATDGSHHVAFLSRRMSHFMSRVKIIQGDGTFKARPALPASCQVFVVVTTWRNSVVPLAWFLMERRTLAAYRAIFGLLKQVCPNVNPECIISDWEKPQQMAWEEAFPNAQIQGCLWHLGKAFVKKAKKLGIMRYRTMFPGVLKYLRYACAIALLPRRFHADGLRVIREAARQHNIVVAYLLAPFFDYVEAKWLNNAYRRNWLSMYLSMHRTNNACENHNRNLRCKVGPHRPNIYLFIQALAKMEYNACLDAELLGLGLPAKAARRWTSVFCDQQIQAFSNDLEENIFHDQDPTILSFLGRVSYLFHGAFLDHVAGEVGRN